MKFQNNVFPSFRSLQCLEITQVPSDVTGNKCKYIENMIRISSFELNILLSYIFLSLEFLNSFVI